MHFDVNDTKVLVCSNYVFCLVLSHLPNLPCGKMLMKWSPQEYIDISVIFKYLGKSHSAVIFGFHASAGCDTVEKFTGISKEKWTKLFLCSDEPILITLTDFQKTIDSTNLEYLEKFVCSAYLPNNSKKDSLGDARWYTFCNKNRAKKKIANKLSETNMIKLPPTTGSLIQHTFRASIQ